MENSGRETIKRIISAVGFIGLIILTTLAEVDWWRSILLEVAWLTGIDHVLRPWVNEKREVNGTK